MHDWVRYAQNPRMDRLLKLLFAVGLCVLSFVFGAAAYQYQVFPYPLLQDAKLAWDAWRQVSGEPLPFALKKFVVSTGATRDPLARRVDPAAGDEYILVTGGPYELTDYCPKFGCMAWIMDRKGRIVHVWDVNLDELWHGLTGVTGKANSVTMFPIGMALGRDGSLVATFQSNDTFPFSIAIAKFDSAGRIVWKRFDYSHHWPALDDEGRIYTPYATFPKGVEYVGNTAIRLECATGQIHMDGIHVLSPEGKVLRDLSVLQSFLRAGYVGWFYGLRDGCDPVHLNSIALVTDEIAKHLPGTKAGDLLISLREPSAIAVIDGVTGEVKYAVSGRTAAQHNAQFLPDGSVLAFDNLGGDRALGGSRVVRVNLLTGKSETVFPRGHEIGLLPFTSAIAGTISVSRDGKRALIADTEQGTIVEIDVATGRVLWVCENIQNIEVILKARHIKSLSTSALFSVFGAYYVRDTGFLKQGATQ
ncbi:MAG: arylsulfotransferase family protein [Burkholderiales bacterium]